MLTLSNLNCKKIKATSATLVDVDTNPGNYSSVKVKIQKNCCTTTYESLIENIGNFCSDYEATLPINLIGQPSLLVVEGYLYTDLTTNLIQSVALGINGNGTVVQDNCNNSTAISQYLFTAGVAAGTSCGHEGTDWNFTIYNCGGSPLPNQNYIPYAIRYRYNGIQNQALFYPVNNAGNNPIVDGSIFLDPTLMGDDITSFGDGIYKITIEAIKINGSSVTEYNCLFVDCESKCKMIDLLPSLTGEEQKDILMLHYGMTEGSLCGCESCDLLCKLYTDFYNMLNNTSLPNSTSCGCS